MKYGRFACALVAASALVAPAVPAAAAPHKTVVSVHFSGSDVVGPLPAGAGITVIHYCPLGSDLDRAGTRAAGEYHDTEQLRVASREYWPAGLVARYRLRTRMNAFDSTDVFSAAVCKSYTAAGATRFAAKAKVDLRVWGPAPAKVPMDNIVAVAVADSVSSLAAGRLFRSSVRAAGVDSHPKGLHGGVEAVQELIEAEGFISQGVRVDGVTKREVAPGQFVSMRNHYRFTADLTKVDRY